MGFSKSKGMGKVVKSGSFGGLQQLQPDSAGIDVGSEEMYVCVPGDRDTSPVRVFGVFTKDLDELADWLAACRIKTVAMESTGIYWISLYELLESRGFEVFLVNAAHAKNVPGRKSDVSDCQWLQQLHSYGLLRASFRPDADIVTLRELVKQRQTLIELRAITIQHMQKALEMMNLKLKNVISDITGVTGLLIIRAIVNGERDCAVLAQHRDHRCKSDEEIIAASLQGHYKSEHVFALKQSLQQYDFYTNLIAECDHEIEKCYKKYDGAIEPVDHPSPRPKKQGRKSTNEPQFDLCSYLHRMAGVDLTDIDGVGALTAQTVLSTIGLDMSKWKTAKHFTSWLGLAPHNDISGRKVLRSKTMKNSNPAATALRMAAQALNKSDSALGAYYRRMRAKLGGPKAIVATARKLATIIYEMLKTKKPYVDIGADYYDKKYQSTQIKKLKKRALMLGFELVAMT